MYTRSFILSDDHKHTTGNQRVFISFCTLYNVLHFHVYHSRVVSIVFFNNYHSSSPLAKYSTINVLFPLIAHVLHFILYFYHVLHFILYFSCIASDFPKLCVLCNFPSISVFDGNKSLAVYLENTCDYPA